MLKEYSISNARKEISHIFDDIQNYIPSLIEKRKNMNQMVFC